MAGAEAILVLGVISSIIAVVDGTKQVYDAATNAEGLPEAFREVADRLPIVTNILGSAKQHIDGGDVDEESCEGVKHVVEACEKKAKTLDDLFRKVIPADGASRRKIYLSAVRTLGKGSRVETLMKGMLEDVQLLTSEHGMKIGTKTEKEQLAKAIAEVLKDLMPSNPILEGSEEDKCLAALFLTDPRDDRQHLVNTKGSRVNGTCEWIKSNTLYDSWLHSHSQLLWLSGGPGKGKTMLSVFLAEELERTAKDVQNTLFLQYFCDNKDAKRNTAITIIRGLIFQLLQFRSKLFDYILPSFKIQKESLFTDSSFETLWRVFNNMLRDPVVGNIYCVLDGLDECDEASLEVLLGKLKALFSPKTGPPHRLKMIVVSRNLPKFIPELLTGVPRIRLDPDADGEVNDDVQRFITERVERLPAYKLCPETLRISVKKVFRERAQGTFLWVALVAKALRNCEATEIRRVLDQFPPGLDELYGRMLLQIDSDRRELAAKILLWVVMAIRPLTLSELGTAVGIDTPEPSDGFSLAEAVRDQVSYCGSFLTIETDEVGLIHQSAKDYLLRETQDNNPELEAFRVKKEVGNLKIARKCMDYLENGALQGGKISLRVMDPDWQDAAHVKPFPLLSYAALHWPEHARSLSCSADIFDLSRPFYHKKSQIRESWLEIYWAAVEYCRPPNSFPLLHLASYFGILPLAENLVRKHGWMKRVRCSHNMNKRDSDGNTALAWAARRGHEAVVRLLLEKGADIKAKDDDRRAVLSAAAERGHEAVVRLLLEKGIDIEVKDNGGRTVLQAAARGGHEAVVRLLLENGADIEAKGCYYKMTALHWAAERGHEAVVRLLLEKGADIEAKDNGGRTVLQVAAREGHEAVVRLLLKKGADIKTKDNGGVTTLQAAVIFGHEAVVRLLLEGSRRDRNTIEQVTKSYS